MGDLVSSVCKAIHVQCGCSGSGVSTHTTIMQLSLHAVNECGLFHATSADASRGTWLIATRPLSQLELAEGDVLYYRRKACDCRQRVMAVTARRSGK